MFYRGYYIIHTCLLMSLQLSESLEIVDRRKYGYLFDSQEFCFKALHIISICISVIQKYPETENLLLKKTQYASTGLLYGGPSYERGLTCHLVCIIIVISWLCPCHSSQNRCYSPSLEQLAHEYTCIYECFQVIRYISMFFYYFYKGGQLL